MGLQTQLQDPTVYDIPDTAVVDDHYRHYAKAFDTAVTGGIETYKEYQKGVAREEQAGEVEGYQSEVEAYQKAKPTPLPSNATPEQVQLAKEQSQVFQMHKQGLLSGPSLKARIQKVARQQMVDHPWMAAEIKAYSAFYTKSSAGAIELPPELQGIKDAQKQIAKNMALEGMNATDPNQYNAYVTRMHKVAVFDARQKELTYNASQGDFNVPDVIDLIDNMALILPASEGQGMGMLPLMKQFNKELANAGGDPSQVNVGFYKSQVSLLKFQLKAGLSAAIEQAGANLDFNDRKEVEEHINNIGSDWITAIEEGNKAKLGFLTSQNELVEQGVIRDLGPIAPLAKALGDSGAQELLGSWRRLSGLSENAFKLDPFYIKHPIYSDMLRRNKPEFYIGAVIKGFSTGNPLERTPLTNNIAVDVISSMSSANVQTNQPFTKEQQITYSTAVNNLLNQESTEHRVGAMERLLTDRINASVIFSNPETTQEVRNAFTSIYTGLIEKRETMESQAIFYIGDDSNVHSYLPGRAKEIDLLFGEGTQAVEPAFVEMTNKMLSLYDIIGFNSNMGLTRDEFIRKVLGERRENK